MIGNYYCYDIPAALHTQMDDYMGNQSDFETYFSLLYTVYSVPNIVLPFFGGYFVDKWGVRPCLFLFTGFLTVGQAVFAFGLSIKSWPIMLAGRVIYGFGGESLSVANAAVLSVWFKGKELAFAFGLNLSIARLGSVINNLVSPQLANGVGIQFAFWFGVFLCAGSMASVIGVSIIDKAMDAKLILNAPHQALAGEEDEDDEGGKDKQQVHTALRKGLLSDDVNAGDDTAIGKMNFGSKESDHQSIGTVESTSISLQRKLSSDSTKKNGPDGGAVKLADVFKFSLAFWVISVSCVVVYGCVLPFNNIASPLLLERDYFMDTPDGCQLSNTNACQSDSNEPINCPSSKWYQPPLPQNITLEDVTYVPLQASDIDCTDDFWSDGCAEEFCSRQDAATVEAGTIMSIPYIISATLSPFLGAFVDRYGFRAVMATLAPGTLVAVHTLLGYTDITPILPLVGQGLSYSAFAAVIWPSVPLVVPEELVGLAYGVITSIQNGGLASFPLIIAVIYSAGGDSYIPDVEFFFICTAVVGVIVGFWLNYIDYMHLDGILNSARASEEEEDKDEEEDDFKVVRGDSRSDRRSSNSKRSSSGSANEERDSFITDRRSNEFKATALG